MSLDRRGFLKCMAWAGTGVLWTVSGGVLSSCTLAPGQSGDLSVLVPGKDDFTAAKAYRVFVVNPGYKRISEKTLQ